MEHKYLYTSNKIKKQIEINGCTIGNGKRVMISGPCTFANYQEIYNISLELKKLGIKFIRGGAFKSRTSPYDFQGLGDDGLKMLMKVKEELGLNIVVEFMTIEQVKKYGNMVDLIQVGSRNMYNYDLLKEIGKLNTPVLLKRGLSASYKEWLLSAEYILKEGNNNIILCERGIRNNISNETRNILDIQAIAYIKEYTNFPIIIDPSHASGKAYMIESMSKASLIAGADGLIIESHTNPSQSLCDSEQTISISNLKKIIDFNEGIE